MERSDKLFEVPPTTSDTQSFFNLPVSRLSSNAFAAVTTTTTVGSGLVFGQAPIFLPSANATTSSTSLPFARFTFGAPPVSQNSAFSFTSTGETSFRSIANTKDSGDQLLFGKPVRDKAEKEESEQKEKILLFGKPVQDEVEKEQLEQKEKITHPSQVERKWRWNAKLGNLSA